MTQELPELPPADLSSLRRYLVHLLNTNAAFHFAPNDPVVKRSAEYLSSWLAELDALTQAAADAQRLERQIDDLRIAIDAVYNFNAAARSAVVQCYGTCHSQLVMGIRDKLATMRNESAKDQP